MYIGALIRQKRKELCLSQVELSQGICVSSHLSKIENGELEPSEEIKILLLKRLGIDNQYSYEFIEKYKNKIQNFHDYVLNFQSKEAKVIYEKLLKQQYKLKYSPLHLDFYIMMYGYYVLEHKSCKKAADAREYITMNEAYLDYQQVFYNKLYQALESNQTKDYENLLPYDTTGYVHFKLGVALEAKGHFYKAAETYDLAISKFVSSGNFRGILFSMLYKGSVLFNMKAYEEAILIYKSLVKLTEQSKSNDSLVRSFIFYGLNNISETYLKLGHYQEAKSYAHKALKSNQSEDGVYGIFPYIILSEYYHYQNDLKEALYYLNQAEEHLKQSKSRDSVYESFCIEKLRYQLNNPNYIEDKAYLALLLHAKNNLVENKLTHLIHSINEDLKAYYISNRKYKNALNITENL